ITGEAHSCSLVRDTTKVSMNRVVFVILDSDFVARWLTLPSSNDQYRAELRQCSLQDVLLLRFQGSAASQEISLATMRVLLAQAERPVAGQFLLTRRGVSRGLRSRVETTG